jgi:DNA-binding MarR family transcriptional regulator
MQANQIETVRAFNRFYTNQIGLLREGLLNSPFSLSEARVLFEIAHHAETTASELANELGMDPGYMSRIVKSLERSDLVQRAAASPDRRQRIISLTEAGHDAFADLNARSRNQFQFMLASLDQDQRDTLVGAMNTIQTILGTEPPPRARAYILRALPRRVRLGRDL